MKSKNIGKKSLILSVCNITTLIITMVISMIVARYRTLGENGTYSQIMLIVNTIISFAVLGIPNSITYFVGRSKNEQDKEKYIGTYYTIMLVICLLVGISLYLLTPYFASYYNNPTLNEFKYVLLVFPLFLQITSTISDVLISFEKVVVLMGYRILYSALLLSINILMVIYRWSFQKYMFIYSCSLLILTVAVYLIIIFILKIKKIIYVDINLLKDILKFSVPMGISSVVGTLSLEFDKLFIAAKFSTETLGMYNYMAKELPIVAITSSVTSILLPTIAGMISRGEKDEAVNLWEKSGIITFSITAFFVCGVFAYAPQVIKILYSSKYLGGLGIFRIYTFSLLLRFTYFGLFFNCTGNSKKVLKYSVFGLLLNGCLNFVFYYALGMIGPAIATVVSLYVTTYLQLKGTAKLLDKKIVNLLPCKAFLKILTLNIILAIIFYELQKIIRLEVVLGDCLEAVMLAVVWCVVYLLICGKRLKKIWRELNN